VIFYNRITESSVHKHRFTLCRGYCGSKKIQESTSHTKGIGKLADSLVERTTDYLPFIESQSSKSWNQGFMHFFEISSPIARVLFGSASGTPAEVPNNSRRRPEQIENLNGKNGKNGLFGLFGPLVFLTLKGILFLFQQ
jgi:hypothetical protein